MKPNTIGIEQTRLEDLKIGDYIKWGYHNFSMNTAGDFLSSGIESLPELPLTNYFDGDEPESKNGGYFYFIKIKNGLLVADRMIQIMVSVKALLKKDYFHGIHYRVPTNIELNELCTTAKLYGINKDNLYDKMAITKGYPNVDTSDGGFVLICQDGIPWFYNGGQDCYTRWNYSLTDYMDLYRYACGWIPMYQYADTTSKNVFF